MGFFVRPEGPFLSRPEPRAAAAKTLFVVLARRNLDPLTTTEKGWLKALS
jgi:hypothetical protein